jgi:TetR/AcrR family transcriptional repressor of nem operon
MSTSKDKLLEVAFNEIYENSYSSTSIDKILKKAKMNKGSMYHFFKSKKELTLEVIDIHVNKYIEDKYSSLLKLDENILDSLIKLIKNKDKYNFTYGCRLNNLVQELSSCDDDFKIALEKVYFRFEEIIELVLNKALKNKELSHPNIKDLAIYVVASIEGCLCTAKKSSSSEIYISCISQLEYYLNSLKI